jgi:prepilin peptidase CpaA
METILSVALVLPVTVIAAITDARTGRIPNWLTVSAACLGVALHAVRAGGAGVLESVSGLIAAGLVPFALHKGTNGRAIGGGDVKLFAGIGAMTGPTTGLEIELSAFVLLGAWASARLAFHGRLLKVIGNALRLAANPLLPQALRRSLPPEAMTEVRMGPIIAVAALVVCCLDQRGSGLVWPE